MLEGKITLILSALSLSYGVFWNIKLMTWSKCIYLKSSLVSVLFSLVQLLETGKRLLLKYVFIKSTFFTITFLLSDGFYALGRTARTIKVHLTRAVCVKIKISHNGTATLASGSARSWNLLHGCCFCSTETTRALVFVPESVPCAVFFPSL